MDIIKSYAQDCLIYMEINMDTYMDTYDTHGSITYLCHMICAQIIHSCLILILYPVYIVN